MKITIPNQQGVERELDIFPLECRGQLVLTAKQLAPILGCSRKNLTTNFSRHINEFVEGVDYFFLHGIELKIFLKYYIGNSGNYGNYKNPGNVSRPQLDYRSAFSPKVHAMYLWTLEGARKHSQYLTTEMAIRICLNYLPAYFNAKNPASESAPQLPPPVQQSLFDDKPTSPPEPLVQPEPSAAPSDDRIELLMELIDKIEDDPQLRNTLIRETASLILGKQI